MTRAERYAHESHFQGMVTVACMLHMVTEYLLHNNTPKTPPEMWAVLEAVEKVEQYALGRIKMDAKEYSLEHGVSWIGEE